MSNPRWIIAEGDRIPNTSDELHCTQATLIMAWKLLSGRTISMTQAEHATGFRAGAETWPYAMIAWLAEQGCLVEHIDAVSPARLMADPERELRETARVDSETTAYVLSISDFAAERLNVDRAIETGRVSFATRRPDIQDILRGLHQGELPLVSLDAGTLYGEPGGYQIHILISTDSRDHGRSLILQDPGPPARWDWVVSAELLKAAMAYPTESAGTVTLVTPPSPAISPEQPRGGR